MQEPKLFDLKQIARVTGMSYRTIRKWHKDGVLPRPSIVRPNTRRYWTSAQISKWWRQLEAVGDAER